MGEGNLLESARSMTDTYGPHYRVTGAVIGRPFFARTRATLEPKRVFLRKKTFVGTVARDYHGRLFTEYGTPSRTFAACIVDSVAGRIYTLDTVRSIYFEGDGGVDIAEEVKGPEHPEGRFVGRSALLQKSAPLG